MSSPTLSPDSLGIAQALYGNFFPALASNREAALSFFGDDSSMFFQGTTLNGKNQIKDFLLKLPDISLRLSGYEVQTVPQSNLWSMVIVVGTVQIGNSHPKTFHSSCYVEARTTDHTAFIRYLSFTSFD